MTNPLKTRLLILVKDPRFIGLLAVGFLMGVAALFAAWKSGVTLADLKNWFEVLLTFLRENPLLLFFAIVILPAFPIPASTLMILAGAVYAPAFGMPAACAITILAMTLNMAWTYFVAAYPGRGLVEKLMERMDITIPALSTGGVVKLIVILRITPGFPFFFQNLILGFLRVPFRLYILLSTALCSISVTGFVVSAGAIFKGNFGLALVGVALVVIAITLAGWLRRRLASKTPAAN